MKDLDLIITLTKYSSSGHIYLLYSVLSNISKEGLVDATHTELAEMLNRSRQAIAKDLQILEEEGYITKKYGIIEINEQVKSKLKSSKKKNHIKALRKRKGFQLVK